ncbi:MAG TPA: hypothetical protein PLB89_17135 [Flavobacteriales bacterium]|nr:hypothetical protein [Flavobacteriales bacterium]
MRRFVALGLGVLLSTSIKAQDEARYADLVKHAYVLYEQKDFKGSAETYSKAFEALGWKGTSNDRYNAACSWALAGVPDSAFFNLERIAQLMDYANVAHLTTDADLNSLHTDARWAPLVAQVQANKDRLEANYDKPLVALLDSIFDEDQTLRRSIGEVEAKYGRDSKEMQQLWRTMAEKDSTNLIVVTRILDERGWLGEDVVGGKGNSALFLVIQHSDQATQEKYLPMMRDAVAKGNARGSSLALLEDRVALGQGKRQTYGSQIGDDPGSGHLCVLPLDDPDHVDERRAAVGLGTLAEYITNWDMTWDVEAYKRELPALEERIKSRRK